MSHREQPDCPECEKLSSVSEESNKIGNFIDWLRENRIHLCKWDDDIDDYTGEPLGYFPVGTPIEKLLADYFDINLEKVEEERRALLDWLRGINS